MTRIPASITHCQLANYRLVRQRRGILIATNRGVVVHNTNPRKFIINRRFRKRFLIYNSYFIALLKQVKLDTRNLLYGADH
jgi:hypothetical protein